MSDPSASKPAVTGRWTWLLFVALAGLSWGTYVPVVFYGGRELTTDPTRVGGRLTSILCVGVAYFFLAVLIPLGLFLSKKHAWPAFKATGLLFSGLAGVMGAVGAIAVIFASKAAVDAAKAAGLPDGSYRAYIAPLIFGLAPVINTLVSLFWHPKPGSPWHFKLEHLPGWKLLLGILLVGLGAFMVLYSKERAEAASKGAAKPAAMVKAADTPAEHPEHHEAHYEWLIFVLVAGLAWGTYVPIVFYGGQELTGKPGELGGRLMSILCVGLAYFLLAVLVPSALMSSGTFNWPQNITVSGLVFSGLAGVAGAVGAICVIFASKSAVDAAKASGLPPASFRIYIAPLIFGVAPVINTVVSLLWHPQKGGDFLHFGLETTPDPLLWLGIISVGAGAFLVLFAKEQSEAAPAKPAGPAK